MILIELNQEVGMTVWISITISAMIMFFTIYQTTSSCLNKDKLGYLYEMARQGSTPEFNEKITRKQAVFLAEHWIENQEDYDHIIIK